MRADLEFQRIEARDFTSMNEMETARQGLLQTGWWLYHSIGGGVPPHQTARSWLYARYVDQTRSSSYRPCGCGCDCPYNESHDQLCWGETTSYEERIDEEEWDTYHACEGHMPVSQGDSYLPEELK